ncbi:MULTISPECIES: dynamin family protein [Microbacterium]|uniref:dynamin family protein n=1 Tax=Microbacterium TaxID=33882 RepID=UPI0025FA22EA|nr:MULTISPECIES: dynamin family protein [Microbacterium]
MTKILIHELPERSQLLLARLQAVLRDSPSTAASTLLARATIDPAGKPRMVLTGQYSSGKSSLIRALTDGAVEPLIDADIATGEVTEYEWDGAVVLVDTPGVQSGLRSHDDLAMDAIGSADFILFVITVNLFDDASRDFLRRLANELQMFGQMIVVITQTSKRSAADGLRQQAVQDALGTATFNLPIVEVDSVDYMRSLEGGNHAEAFRQRSRMDDLRAAINRVSAERGDLARLRQPLHLIRQLCDDAQELFVHDDTSRAALTLLAAQTRAISQRRFMLDRNFTRADVDFKRKCRVDVVGFVDSASTLPADEAQARTLLEDAEARLVEALERHASEFAERINNLAGSEFDTLSEELLEIGASNRLGVLLRPSGAVSLEAPDRVHSSSPTTAAPKAASNTVDWQKIGDLIERGQGWWGAGDGLREASGSLGHKLVKDVGHTFGHKFKPWQAIKIADKIGKAAKVGGFLIQAGTAGYEVWKNEHEARTAQIQSERQHSALVTEIMGHADKIASDARRELSAIIDPRLDQLLDEIRAAQDEILNAEHARGAAADELRAIAAEADRLLSEGSDGGDARGSR